MKISTLDIQVAYACPDCNETKFESLAEVLDVGQPLCHECSKTMEVNYIDFNNRNLSGDDVAQVFSDFVNSFMGKRNEDFVNRILRDHRTLQQNMFRIFYQCIERWAKDFSDNRFDPRNEHTVKACYSITRLFPEGVALPFI